MNSGSEILGSNISLFWPSFVSATLIAFVHLRRRHFRFMQKPGNPWVPASAGIALAYVFMDIFPHLAKMQSKMSVFTLGDIYGTPTHISYIVCLIGFAVYLGVFLSVKRHLAGKAPGERSVDSAPVLIKIVYASLVAYSFLIGYLLSEQATHRPEPVLLFGAAMAMHFAGTDGLVYEHDPNYYDRSVRFMFVASVYIGWFTGVLMEISDTTLTLLFAFLAGGLIVVTTIHELPHIQNRKQYGAFVIGAGVFSALVLATEKFG